MQRAWSRRGAAVGCVVQAQGRLVRWLVGWLVGRLVGR